jgi:uncharacterized protein (TIGR00730 family)
MNLRFGEDNGAVDMAISELLEIAGPITHQAVVRDMIIAALKAGQEGPLLSDLKVMCSTLKEMRYTSKVFSSYRGVPKVTVFGSARTEAGSPLYHMAIDLGRKLAAAGFMVITGGGPGIMHAIHEGAGAEHSFGVGIRLPFEQKSNPVINGSPRDITYKYFFNRKLAFIKEACAVVLFPGGFGTLDEAMEALTLLQTGKRYPIPIVLLDRTEDRYWSSWIDFIHAHCASTGYIGPNDFSFFHHTHDNHDAVSEIQGFYRRYHSMRFVEGKCVIRMVSEMTSASFERIKRDFACITAPGREMALTSALPREGDEPEISHLPRLVLDFDKRDFGKLRQLVSAINNAQPIRYL